MTTLIVTIPAYNERSTIAEVVGQIPRHIPGIDNVQVLVFDDGSTDGTGQIAHQAGADVILAHRRNKGLAITFRECLDAALALGADIIVNTDADNHYDQTRIPQLVEPILSGTADIVIGSRDLNGLREMGGVRRWGNRIANFLFSFLYGLPPGTDVSSGFRAYSREAALRLTVTSRYTYTHETLIAARDHGLTIVSRLLPARDVSRPSRLMSSVGSHILRAGSMAVLSFVVHRLFRILALVSGLLVLAGAAAFVRFLFLYFSSGGAGHIQSLIAGSLLIILGIQLLIGSFFAAGLAKNRQLMEEMIYQQRRQNYEPGSLLGQRDADRPDREMVPPELTLPSKKLQ